MIRVLLRAMLGFSFHFVRCKYALERLKVLTVIML